MMCRNCCVLVGDRDKSINFVFLCQGQIISDLIRTQLRITDLGFNKCRPLAFSGIDNNQTVRTQL